MIISSPPPIPAGSNGYVQFNNNGAFGASSSFYWDNTSSLLSLGASSSLFCRLYITGTGGNNSAILLEDSTAGANVKRLRIINSAGTVTLSTVNDAFSGLTATIGSFNLSTGEATFTGFPSVTITSGGSAPANGFYLGAANRLFFQTNSTKRCEIDNNGNFVFNNAGVGGGTPSFILNGQSANSNVVVLAFEQQNTGTSAGIGAAFHLYDSTSVAAQAGALYWQKTAAWTNGTATTFDAKCVIQTREDNVLTTYAEFDGNILAVKFYKSTVIGSAALATTATDGFLYIPTSAGAPTGVPTTQTGTVALEYDTTNNNLYVYNGAWKKVALA